MNSRLLSLTVALVLSSATFAINFETDRTWYLAGEPMQVSVTAEDGTIAYAELCDTYGLAAGALVSLKDGKGTCIVELPSELHSGYYVLSVYTSHSGHVAQRLVAVINPLHKHEDDDIQWVEITHPDSLSYLSPVRTADTSAVKTVSMYETEGHIIRARVQNVYNGNHFHGNQIRPAISIIGKQIHYFEGKMVNDSLAVFYTFGIHGRQPLVLSAETTTGISLPIEIISPFATLLPQQLPHLVFHYNRSEVEARSIDMQRHQSDADETIRNGLPSDYDDTLFGNKPELSYNLDEYRQFFTIREVLLEYVDCVRSKKINGATKLLVRRAEDSYISSWPAMVLIDGMPVMDIERLLNYDARRIHYINIYGDSYTFGNGIYHGVLSFITRSGRLTNYPVEPNMQYLVYEFPQ